MKRLIVFSIIGLSFLNCINPAGILESSQVDIIITEIMYNRGTDTLEFIEFKNRSLGRVNIGGYYFSSGIEFQFPDNIILDKDVYFILTNSEELFTKLYPDVSIAGIFTGRLSNSSESVTLCNLHGNVIAETEYKDSGFWPAAADGLGFSIVTVNEENPGDQKDASNWMASSEINGSPGKPDHGSKGYSISVNEIVASTFSDKLDMIELYNPDTEKVDVSNWYLTDDRHDPYKYIIPENSIIEPEGYLVFNGSMFKSDISVTIAGGQVYLFSASDEILTGYSHGIEYESCDNGDVFGLLENSEGECFCTKLEQATPGKTNSSSFSGEIIITEIMYHPEKGESEFLEIINRSEKTIKLFDEYNLNNNWEIKGIGFKFPLFSYIEPKERIVLIDSTMSPEGFREKYSVDSTIKVFTYSGKLSNSGETVSIQKPGDEYIDETGLIVVPYQSVDIVSYKDDYPWPKKADGDGYSLVRKSFSSWGCESSEWKASDVIGGTPGK